MLVFSGEVHFFRGLIDQLMQRVVELRYAIPCNAPGVLQILCRSGEVRMLPLEMDSWDRILIDKKLMELRLFPLAT